MVNMPLAKVKPIIPGKMKIDELRAGFKKDITAFRRRVVTGDFRGTVRPWKHETPNFKSDVNEGKDFVIRAYLVKDGSLGSNKWLWLNAGTKERWALMSGDWQSKTTPGTLNVRGGRGRVLVAGRRRMRRPRPGIKARNWTELIFQLRNPEFVDIMDAINKSGLDKLYG